MQNYIHSKSLFPVTWLTRVNPIYRILSHKEYIDDFFDNGNIFLSSFKNFKEYEDEMQGDVSEGQNMIGGFNDEGAGEFIFYEGGENAYVLCSTNILNDVIINDFNGVGAIKINDTVSFGKELARKLPFVNTGIGGDCIYGDSRTQILENEKNKTFQNMDFNNPLLMKEEISQITMGIELFMKFNKYKHQQEHRLLWFSARPIKNNIVVHCPEAIKHCEKIIF